MLGGSITPRYELVPVVFSTNAWGGATALAARPHAGEILLVSMPLAGTALTAQGGTTDFVATRVTDGGTVVALTNVSAPFSYEPRDPVHTVSAGTTAYTLGIGPQMTEGVPVFGSISVSVASGQPNQSGTLYLRYRR